ncbi:hypothetical protein JCM13304A_04710 [Desulfothermus okinawensis JCM 13304]
MIKTESPDIIILGRDIFESNLKFIKKDIRKIFGLFKGHYVFFVFGNHEHYTNDISEIKRFLNENNIILLNNTNYLLDNISLIGVDDPAGHGKYSKKQLNSWLNKISHLISKDKFNILISHRPWGFKEFSSKNGIDLQLGGHTHKGQIYPFNYLVKLFYPFIYGKYSQNETNLIVSMGFGTWGPPMRILTENEAVIVEIKPRATPF